MADIDVLSPGDSDVISSFPADERASRAALLALTAGTMFGGGNMGGSANAHTLTVSNTGLTLTNGLVVWGKAAATNTGACTLQINSLAAKTIALPNNNAISSSHPGAITENEVYFFMYHVGDVFYVLNPSGYMDQKLYDRAWPVGSTLLRTTETAVAVPFGVTATWTRQAAASYYLRVAPTGPVATGGSLTTGSAGAHDHTVSVTGTTDEATGTGSGVGLRTEGATHVHGFTGTGTTDSEAAHEHSIEPVYRAYVVWERTA